MLVIDSVASINIATEDRVMVISCYQLMEINCADIHIVVAHVFTTVEVFC